MLQVCGPVLRPLFFGVRRVVADDDEQRKRLLCCNSVAGLYSNGGMSHKHEEEIPVAIESVVARLGDLEVVLGAHAAPTIAAVQALLIEAMAARDRGDTPTALARIGQAMDRLAALADNLDPAEATLMRALARNFRAALLYGDEAGARESTQRMFEKAGAIERKKP
jgi:hypothetical protein